MSTRQGGRMEQSRAFASNVAYFHVNVCGLDIAASSPASPPTGISYADMPAVSSLQSRPFRNRHFVVSPTNVTQLLPIGRNHGEEKRLNLDRLIGLLSNLCNRCSDYLERRLDNCSSGSHRERQRKPPIDFRRLGRKRRVDLYYGAEMTGSNCIRG